jgi:hypothetical protein
MNDQNDEQLNDDRTNDGAQVTGGDKGVPGSTGTAGKPFR